MVLALSTSCMAGRHWGAPDLLQMLKNMDIAALELDYRLQRPVYDQLKTALPESRIKVVSLHNYCPCPALRPGAAPSGDYFRLSTLDREERRWAVQWTTKTLEQAHELEASYVVLHCGSVDLEGQHQLLRRLLEIEGRDSENLQRRLAQAMALRAQHHGRHLEALLFSLDRLLPIAEKYHIVLGLENRYHYHELPDPMELEVILAEFKGGPIGYWHDTGHAHAHEQLGIISQQQLLAQFAEYLVGIHLHDARGLDDHLAPGSGEIELEMLKPFLDAARPVVIELAPGTPQSALQEGLTFTRSLCPKENAVQLPDFSLDLPKNFI